VFGMCDPLLAVSSMLLGGAAAYVILSIAERMRAPDQGPVTVRWLIIGAVAAGLEIWAIHYIGNLAFCPPVSGAQDSLLAVLSLLSAGMTGAGRGAGSSATELLGIWPTLVRKELVDAHVRVVVEEVQ